MSSKACLSANKQQNDRHGDKGEQGGEHDAGRDQFEVGMELRAEDIAGG